MSEACGSARSNQVERIRREGIPRLPVSVGEQHPRDAMVTDASHRATACFLIGQVRCRTHGPKRYGLATRLEPVPRTVSELRPHDANALNDAASRAAHTCCRLTTAYNLLMSTPQALRPPVLKGSPRFSETSAVNCRQLLPYQYRQALRGHRFAGDSTGLKGALPEQGMRYGHQAG